MKTTNKTSILQRLTAPTPKIFKILRIVGLSLAAAGGAILAAPSMPVLLVSAAGYLIASGTVMTAVSQVAIEGE